MYNKTKSMMNDRVVYKQDNGDNWLFHDTRHFCIGDNPDLPCEEAGILAKDVPTEERFTFRTNQRRNQRSAPVFEKSAIKHRAGRAYSISKFFRAGRA